MPPIAHWHGIETREGEVAPLVEGSLGWLECRVAAEHDVGDHVLVVGEVAAARAGASRPALVYRDRSYHAL